MRGILRQLKGGDRRSIGNADAAARRISNTPSLFADLFEGMFAADPVIRMRAADVVEKATRHRPDFLQPWKKPLLEKLSVLPEKEVRWHIAQLIPRLTLTSSEQKSAVEILLCYLDDESSIVRTFSMQALADLSAHDARLRSQVRPLIERLTLTGTPAMRSRGRKLLRQFANGNS